MIIGQTVGVLLWSSLLNERILGSNFRVRSRTKNIQNMPCLDLGFIYRDLTLIFHLGYGEAGIIDLIPPNAMLRIKLWVQNVQIVT